MTKLDKSIFREYDIRGVVGDNLTDEAALLIGKSFGTSLQLKEPKKLKVSVGRDVRLSSDDMSESLIKGLISVGVDVVDIGVCPTPLLYFSLYHLALDGGIMITGSHNPPEFNGFKMCMGKETIYGESIQALKEIIDRNEFCEGNGDVETCDIITPYREYILNAFSSLESLKQIKVVVDSGNGTNGSIVPKILRELNCEVVELYSEPDGRFPNHHPDPTVLENLNDLVKAVITYKADFGVAYDGDGDRIGVVDESGDVIWGDRLMSLYARDIIENQKLKMKNQKFEKPVFIGDVKCSQIMYDDIDSRGGRSIMWKTGHSLIKAKMKEVNALLAGEMSGHIFFADRYFGFDDAIYATLRLVEIVKESSSGLKELLSDLPESHVTPEIRVDCPDNLKFVAVSKVKEKFEKFVNGYQTIHLPDDMTIKKLITIDGVRVVMAGGWALLRASNTQPVLVLRFEAETEDELNRIRDFFEKELDIVLKELED